MLKVNDYLIFVKRVFYEVVINIEFVEVIWKRLRVDGMKLEKSFFSEMFKNIIYIGKILVFEYKKEFVMVVDGRYEVLIDIEIFNKV